MSNTPSAFTKLTQELDYLMLVVTTVAGDERAGCLVGFSTQCSIHPGRYLVCLSEKNHTTRVAQRAEGLAVHFLSADEEDLAELFGGQTGDDIDKFKRCEWHPGPRGLPILDRCGKWFAGRILDHRPLGDHVGFLLEPIDAENDDHGRRFWFHRAKRLEPGHAP